MRNIGLKARLRDWSAAVAACDSTGAVWRGLLRQTDRYFHVPHGRLKVRHAEPGDDQLVYVHTA